MRIALLHTADVHVETFDQVFGELGGADVQLEHHVDVGLLERARMSGAAAVRDDVFAALRAMASADVILCTCSTLGPIADELAPHLAHLVRIDRPLMVQAVADGSRILVAFCLDSTKDATLDLLNACARDAEREIAPRPVHCSEAWAHFEAGNLEAYAASISDAICSEARESGGVDSIVLAQASMRVAEDQLAHLGVPVRSSPMLAAQHCLAFAHQRLKMSQD